MIMEKEIWETIMEDSRYEISNLGRVRNKKSGHFLACNATKSHRHPQVFLMGNQWGRLQLTVSHLVVEHFGYGMRLPYGTIVGHKDGDITNNRIENLYIVNKT